MLRRGSAIVAVEHNSGEQVPVMAPNNSVAQAWPRTACPACMFGMPPSSIWRSVCPFSDSASAASETAINTPARSAAPEAAPCLIPIANPRFFSYSGEFIEHTVSLPIGQTVRAAAANPVGKAGNSARLAEILLTTPRSEEQARGTGARLPRVYFSTTYRSVPESILHKATKQIDCLRSTNN